MTEGRGGSKKAQICVTSFMNDHIAGLNLACLVAGKNADIGTNEGPFERPQLPIFWPHFLFHFFFCFLFWFLLNQENICIGERDDTACAVVNQL